MIDHPAPPETRACNRLDGLLLASAKDGMWVCEKGGEKKSKKKKAKDETARVKDGEGAFFFLSRER